MIENEPQTLPVAPVEEPLERSEPSYTPEDPPLYDWEDDEEDIDKYTDDEDE